jgi:hypothetical protein
MVGSQLIACVRACVRGVLRGVGLATGSVPHFPHQAQAAHQDHQPGVKQDGQAAALDGRQVSDTEQEGDGGEPVEQPEQLPVDSRGRRGGGFARGGGRHLHHGVGMPRDKHAEDGRHVQEAADEGKAPAYTGCHGEAL